MDLYPWLRFVHVLAAIVFALAHGVSTFVLYRVRAEGDRARLAALADLSASSFGVGMGALLVSVVAGIWAAIAGGHFAQAWPWAAIVTLVVVGGLMTPLAAIPMNKVRHALGIRIRGDTDAPPPAGDDELAALRGAVRPGLVSAIGVGGLAILVGLMSLKPF
jgi:hypothetical protein